MTHNYTPAAPQGPSEPASPPGALRCPLRPQYDKKGGKIRWTTEFFFAKIISYLTKMTSNLTKYISN